MARCNENGHCRFFSRRWELFGMQITSARIIPPQNYREAIARTTAAHFSCLQSTRNRHVGDEAFQQDFFASVHLMLNIRGLMCQALSV